MTSSTLIKSFERAKEDNRAALLTYTVGGDPDKKTSLNIFKSIAESGADIIECGLGHGANIGDGGAIQDSTYRALSSGIKTDDIFEIIEEFKKDYETDVIIMTYQNTINGVWFVTECSAALIIASAAEAPTEPPMK